MQTITPFDGELPLAIFSLDVPDSCELLLLSFTTVIVAESSVVDDLNVDALRGETMI